VANVADKVGRDAGRGGRKTSLWRGGRVPEHQEQAEAPRLFAADFWRKELMLGNVKEVFEELKANIK
jgi:hypothetical protein